MTFSKCVKDVVIKNDTDLTFSIIFWIQFFTVSAILSFGFAPFLFKKIMLESERFETLFSEIIDGYIND